MAMKRKFIIYAPGNRNYGYCRLHFGYQIIKTKMVYMIQNMVATYCEIIYVKNLEFSRRTYLYIN